VKRLLTIVLVGLLALSASVWATGAQDKPAPAAAGGGAAPAGKGPSWVADNLELTYWTQMDARTAATRASHNEVPAYQEAEKLTGVKVRFIHPAAAQATEQFNLMIASGDLPDMVNWSWLTFPGGPEKAIGDKVILKLNDLVKANAPAIGAFLNGRPDIGKKIVTDQGSMYVVPFLRPWIREPSEKWQGYSTSAHFRKDWLEEMGLPFPKTIDEWEKTLTAFKGRGANIIPMASIPDGAMGGINGLRWMLGAWGLDYDFYVVDGRVRNGAISPEFKEWLTLMNRWYKAGLIDQDWISRKYEQVRGLVVEGRVGVYWGLLNRDMGGFTPLGKKSNPKFSLMAASWPYGKDGKSYSFDTSGANDYPGAGAAVTVKSKRPAESVKWLNFWWTETGHNLANFGIEGLTYNWVNGYPKYTDLVMKNPDGLSVVNALSKYAPDGGGGRAWRQDSRYWEQMMAIPEQFESGKMLVNTGDMSRVMPAVSPTAEESKELAAILSQTSTYRDEMVAKFIVGSEPLTKFDDFVARINSMGMPRAIAIQQGALDRFQGRQVPKF
jgi:putative aldouronate transport system substrate-binding protein